MAQYKIKDAKTANLEEIYFDKNLNKMCYKDAYGIVTPITNNAKVESIIAGTNITVDDTDPANPIVSALGGDVEWGAITGDLFNQIDLQAQLDSKQEYLFSGTNIKTINGSSVLGSGNLVVGGAPAWLESNATDLTLWNNGKGNVASNTSFGDGALKSNTSGANNTALGYNALGFNSANNNVAIGSNTMYANTTGTNNVAIGFQALDANTTGIQNIAIGVNALGSATTASGNMAIGHLAQANTSSGVNNTAVGDSSMAYRVVTGNNNTALGGRALYGVSSGSNNTAVGVSALSDNQSGSSNVAIGRDAISGNQVGNNNTAIGYYTVSGDFSGSVILGYQATATNNNQFVVGSVGTPSGAVTTESLSSTKTWSVIINGVTQKILLA